MKFEARTCPIYINVRDRLTDLNRLVAWLEDAGYENIILLDNASTYPPLLEYLGDGCPHEVVHLEENYGSRSLWRTARVPNEYFVLTDPDVLPTEECPPEVVEYLYEALRAWPRTKAAMGLYLEDVPDFRSRAWEESLVSPRRRLGYVHGTPVFESASDTTFALWQPYSSFGLNALRLGAPMQCRHLPWYHLDEPTEEERYYLKRAITGPLGTSWSKQ
jgi:hypothetical protein